MRSGGKDAKENAERCEPHWRRFTSDAEIVLFMNLGLLVENIEPAIAAFHVKRADPTGRWHPITANGVLFFPINEQRRVRVQPLHFKMIEPVTFDCASRAADEWHDLGLVRNAAEPHLNMIVREKFLEKFAVTIFPGFPGFLFQCDKLVL